RWYSQAGTPRLSVEEQYKDGALSLTFKQSTAATPGQDHKDPRVIPIAVGLLGQNGDEVLPTQVLEMTQAEQTFTFEGLSSKPVPSILRGFSAPVILERATTNAERAFLLAHDTDPFNKWEAGRDLAKDSLLRMIRNGEAPDGSYLEALHTLTRDNSLDPAFRALALRLPSQDDLAQSLFEAGEIPDPTAIWAAHETMKQAIAERMQDLLPKLYAEHQVDEPYSPDADQASKRDLANGVLGLLSRLDGGAAARKQYADADNMTQQLSALSELLGAESGDAELQAFYEQWQHERLVIDKWFGLQVGRASPVNAAKITEQLTNHADFNHLNPNRFRAVFGSLTMNTAGFHAEDGSAYSLLADWLIKLDAANPQTTARMCSAFETWRRFDPTRQDLIQTQLKRIGETPNLSRDTSEMIDRILG
ncbi:MAG: DUF3458 domain-containing protein, partial [Paracoccaceae bacterium]|nr:DUF3458 domain-containing protein [Paracoccaceae bacterium]